MNIKTYISGLSHNEKAALAEKAGTSLAYLSQLANGHRKAGLKTVFALEDASGGELSRQIIRPDIFGDAA